ncbi:MAG: PqqD family protein [Roseobacter sp.]
MPSENHYVAQADVVDCDIGGDRALLHLQTNTYFTMNATASALWLALADPRTLDELVGVVTEKFEVSDDQCRPDIELMLSQMKEANVIDIQPTQVS